MNSRIYLHPQWSSKPLDCRANGGRGVRSSCSTDGLADPPELPAGGFGRKTTNNLTTSITTDVGAVGNPNARAAAASAAPPRPLSNAHRGSIRVMCDLIERGLPAPFGGTSRRFWDSLDQGSERGCWLWIGSFDSHGYGRMGDRLAHRIAWVLARGAIAPGMVVMHRCDTPACCNPDHLQLGTNADNQADKVAKDRQAKGSRNGRAKLTESDVVEIRALASRPDWPGPTEVARRYGVTRRAIRFVVDGDKWRHVAVVSP
jgi:hypothetical protein